MTSPVDAGIARAQITGLVLAGGRSRRWGGVDKAWQPFAGRPLIHSVCERLEMQSAAVWISANRDPDRYGALGRRVLVDDWPDGRGPLAGIATALRRIETPWLLVAPVDSPGVPLDLALHLGAAACRANRFLATAVADGRLQPAFLLIHRDLAVAVVAAVDGEVRRLSAWVQAQEPALLDARAVGWIQALRGANDATELAALSAATGHGAENVDGRA